MAAESQRTLGLFGATGIGVGAIVGGGILVLAGPAFALTGPSAVLAFALNGAIALLTALSFAEMASVFPESGGAYAFARKVLNIRAAFGVGWVMWLSHLIAAGLYALGFAAYAVALLDAAWPGAATPAWLTRVDWVPVLGALAVVGYGVALVRREGGGGQWASAGKVVLFAFFVLVGLAVWAHRSGSGEVGSLRPFFPRGSFGLLQAMGTTFITLQGFELVAAMGGKIKNPKRNIPRAMLLSLGIALVLYLPLLVVMATAGVPGGETIQKLAADNPDTVMAVAMGHILGPSGFWLVGIAAVLATLSALHANLLAASHVAATMGRDRTLPSFLERRHRRFKTPAIGVYASALGVVVLVLVLPDLGAAGAAAGLIFLVVFALGHLISVLARRRALRLPAFRAPWFPVVPVLGGTACVALGLYQAIAAPIAAAIAVVWLGLGALLYLGLFSGAASRADAAAEGVDPSLAQLRGRTPLVLVPIANPASAAALVEVAGAVAPPTFGRVLLLTVIAHGEEAPHERPHISLNVARDVLGEALDAARETGHRPDVLITLAPVPWAEIVRVAETHRCESLLLGMTQITEEVAGGELESLLTRVRCDVTILRSPPGWRLAQARRVVVPIGGAGKHDRLRARLLGTFSRTASPEITYVRILPTAAGPSEKTQASRALRRLGSDETPPDVHPVYRIVQSDDVIAALEEQTRDADLVVLGLPRSGGKRVFGGVALELTQRTSGATLLLCQR